MTETKTASKTEGLPTFHEIIDLLFRAIREDDLDTVRWFINAGYSPNASNSSGMKPLSQALLSLKAKMVEAFIIGNARLKSSIYPRFFRKDTSQDQVLEVLNVLQGRSFGIDITNDAGETLLMIASECGLERIVDYAISNRAKSFLASEAGDNPLHFAARGTCSPAIIAKLCAAGAYKDAANNLGLTPLMLAAKNPDGLEGVKALLANGANPRIVSKGKTAATMAAESGNTEVAELLSSAGLASSGSSKIKEEGGVAQIG